MKRSGEKAEQGLRLSLAPCPCGEGKSEKATSPQPLCAGGEGEAATRVVCLTKTQMAAALQISVRSLNKMMARGEIAYFKIGSHLVRFRVEDALKRMEETVFEPLIGADGEGIFNS